MRYGLVVLWMLFWSVPSAIAQVSVGIGLPGVSIGINLPVFPALAQVPGYPVYYAPRLHSNFFFYDGMYWIYQGDNWYASSWYNGPWILVGPEAVPLFVLRIPVRYYRDPPVYFRGWRPDRPPRWGERWGNEWEQHRSGWDKWNRSAAPAPAPLPAYQRRYSGERYPGVEQQQQALHSRNYRYRPHDALVRPYYPRQAVQKSPVPIQREQQAPRERSPGQQDIQRFNPPSHQQGGSAVLRPQPPQRGGEDVQRSAPLQVPPRQRGAAMQEQGQQPHQAPTQREQHPPRSIRKNIPDGRDASQGPGRGLGQGPEGDERGRERGR